MMASLHRISISSGACNSKCRSWSHSCWRSRSSPTLNHIPSSCTTANKPYPTKILHPTSRTGSTSSSPCSSSPTTASLRSYDRKPRKWSSSKNRWIRFWTSTSSSLRTRAMTHLTSTRWSSAMSRSYCASSWTLATMNTLTWSGGAWSQTITTSSCKVSNNEWSNLINFIDLCSSAYLLIIYPFSYMSRT